MLFRDRNVNYKLIQCPANMTTLKGIFPDIKPVRRKNFIHENVKNLHRIKKSSTVEETQKSQVHNRKVTNNNDYSRKSDTKQCESMHANQNSDLRNKSSVPVINKTATCTKKPNNNTNQKKGCQKQSQRPVKKLHSKVLSDSNLSFRDANKSQTEVRNQGIQTLNTTEIDNLYSEGIIKYPSRRCLSSIEADDGIDKPLDGGDAQKSEGSKNESKDPKEEIDFVKLNKENSAANKVAGKNNSNANSCKSSNNAATVNHRMGVVPKYIKHRKETLEKIEKAKIKELDNNCPDGHVPLPDEERRETLRVLRKNYQDYVNELNMMPIKVDTLRAQRRKIEIEKQLNKLEEGIKVFSRPKVYVKMNE